MTQVHLRPLREDDVDDILQWVNDPAIVGNIAAFSGEPFTREQELAYVRGILSSSSDVAYSVFDDDDIYVGQVGVHQIHGRSRVGRLGCIVSSKDRMGQGIGSAAIAQMLDVAFADDGQDLGDGRVGLGLHKVWLMIFSHNDRSHRTYKRLGFIEEGVLREEYFHDDGWHDMIRMSLLAREWLGRVVDEEEP